MPKNADTGKERFCSICKIRFLEALWCGSHNCPCTPQRRPTEEQKEKLGMNDERSQ